ncbi:uncharacterized protein I303_106885 [Kwoniella dejecticola CBS 10117]|uniref:Uncharacterized protein n=1 Tax=Kwoniella dejecticola CBS 10117 TaxID=1296121 RepID=A0A1A5ZTF2_9TREE|nr:uncharacterized protein I303_08476 [Kwoniella dejecticola CBS 10117]OBR81094.1 hypothetical protein I303_08476 [Kwoniella dejecticola CBS 10117]
MPYIPPGSNQIQPIAIPIERTHQLALDRIPKDLAPDPSNSADASDLSNGNEEGSPNTPRPVENDGMSSAAAAESINKRSPTKEDSIESLSSAIAATSLYSNISTPPLDEYDPEDEEGSKTRNHSSPATSSVISLPEQNDKDDNVKTSRSDSSLRRRVNEVNDVEAEAEAEEEEGKKVAGEDAQQQHSKMEGLTQGSTRTQEQNAFDLYRQGLYAYTHTLWIQAKLSSSRAERRRQSVSVQGSFGAKQSGMEKMAAKKALAKRLNG